MVNKFRRDVKNLKNAHVNFARGNFDIFCSTALKLLYRARYLALIVIGENHPEVALIDSNIGLILHAVGEYDLSIKFLERALALNIKYHEPRSLKAAVSYHLVIFLALFWLSRFRRPSFKSCYLLIL